MQKWGNRRANLYWEAHLKQGHVPPDHKVESFIRSKYELRRWAKDGPLPSDPATLDGGNTASTSDPGVAAASGPSPTATSSASAARPAAKANVLDLLGSGDVAPSAPTTSVTNTSGANLLDDFDAPPSQTISTVKPASQRIATVSAAAPPQPASKPSGAGGGLFDLDWHEGANAAAASATSPRLSGGNAKTGNKSDILSLYATARPAAPAVPTSPQQGGLAGLNSSFGGLNMGTGGPTSSGAVPTASNPWSPSTQTTSLGASSAYGGTSDPWASNNSAVNSGAAFTSGSDIWGNSTTTTTNNGFASNATKKNDAFDDIWSDFK